MSETFDPKKPFGIGNGITEYKVNEDPKLKEKEQAKEKAAEVVDKAQPAVPRTAPIPRNR